MLQKIPSWKLMSKGEREHIKAYHIRKNALLKLLPMLLILKRKDVSCLQEGKDMIVCVVTIFVLMVLFALIFFPYLLPLSNIRFRGRKSSFLGEENLCNSLHIFIPWGHVLNRVLSAHSLHVNPILVLLWFPVLTLIVLVLSNLVFSGSSLPKSAQDHKVSICITLMCMRISC